MAVKKFSLEAVIDLTDKMTKPMQNVEKKMTGFSKKMQKNFGGVGNNINAMSKGIDKIAVGAVVGAAALGAGAFAVGKSFVDAAGEVQGYKAVLKTMLGSQDAANKRFEEMSKFAATTPFELKDVVSLGNQLQALGKYSVGTMTNLGDLAAASKKPIEQVMNAFAKLVSGQKGEAVNMFRDLLIGNEDWVAATGKGVKKTGELMATTDEMLAALPKILATKGFTGMMDEMSKTHEGIMSNFSDAVFQFKASIGEGLLGAVDKLMLTITNIIQKMMTVFKVKGKSYVDALAAGIERLADKLASIDVSALVDKVTSFMDFLIGIKNFIVTFGPTLLILAAEIKLIAVATSIWSAALVILEAVGAPVFAIVLAVIVAIALLTVGIIALVRHWPEVKKFIGEFGNGLLLLLGPVGIVINNIMILVQSLSGIGAAFKNGGFIEGMKAIGATILQVLIKPLAQLFSMLSKIPAIGGAFSGIANGLTSASSGLDMAINGHKDNYVNPSTRTAASSSTTTTRNVVDLQAPAGWGMMPQGYGGSPRQTLNFGGVQ